jgi:hypothetical protein
MADRFGIRKYGDPVDSPGAPGPAAGQRSWWRHPVVVILGGLLVVGVLGSAIGNGQNGRSGSGDTDSGSQEGSIGRSLAVGDFSAKVSRVGFQERINSIFEDGYAIVQVLVSNKSDRTQSFSPVDWRIETPSGEILAPVITGESVDLGSGSLVPGGATAGRVNFEIGLYAEGPYTIIFQPDSFSEGRWKVNIRSRRSQER